jgi:hypothetical protein
MGGSPYLEKRNGNIWETNDRGAEVNLTLSEKMEIDNEPVQQAITEAAAATGKTPEEVARELEEGKIVHWDETPDTSVQPYEQALQALKKLDDDMVEAGVTGRADPYYDGEYHL